MWGCGEVGSHEDSRAGSSATGAALADPGTRLSSARCNGAAQSLLGAVGNAFAWQECGSCFLSTAWSLAVLEHWCLDCSVASPTLHAHRATSSARGSLTEWLVALGPACDELVMLPF